MQARDRVAERVGPAAAVEERDVVAAREQPPHEERADEAVAADDEDAHAHLRGFHCQGSARPASRAGPGCATVRLAALTKGDRLRDAARPPMTRQGAWQTGVRWKRDTERDRW